ALTPTLRRLEGETARVRTVAPSTTATAMVSLHTGLPPLQHGVLGYLTHDPEHGQPLNHLIGDPDVVPEQWMPEPGLGERPRRRLEGEAARVRPVAPSTPATALVSLHTGRPPLQHGVLGYLTHDPEHGQPLNHLIGDPDVVPEQWMPEPGLGERTRRRAVQV